MQETRQGRVLAGQNGVDGTTRSFAAMNVNEATTSGAQVKTFPPLPSNATQNIESARAQNNGSAAQYRQERSIEGNRETPKIPTHRRNLSGIDGDLGNPTISPDIIPDRDSSMKRKPLPSVRTDTNTNALNNTSPGRERLSHPKGPQSPRGQEHTRSIDVAPNDPSPLVPHFTRRSAASPTSTTFSSPNDAAGETQASDLRLPATFDLNNTERTRIETRVMPAVTQERIHIQRTEVVTKAIHRDIHIDHHYFYVQPIPVLEILPARHFWLDPKTGLKTEIPAPEGYKLPAHLEPRKAEDYSHLTQATRHYVVDEDNPLGQFESPPLRHKSDISAMQET